MRTITRRIVSTLCVLAIAMSMVMLPYISNKVEAISGSETQARQWMDGWLQKGGKINNGGTQCVAVINEYMQKVLGIDPWSQSYTYAYQLFDKNYSGLTKIAKNDISRNGGYKVGDIIVIGQNSYSPTAGHVAIVYSVSGSTVTKFEQSASKNIRKANMDSVESNAVRGVLRPAWSHAHDYNIPSVSKAPTATSNGTWTLKCSCGASQTITIPAIKDANIRDGVYRLAAHDNNNMYVSVTPNQSHSGGSITLYRKDVADQKFTIKRNSDGTYTMYYGNLAVDVCGGWFAGVVRLWEPNNEPAQKWYIVNLGGGYYRFVCKATYYNMDVAENNMNQGTTIMTWYDNGNNAQKFKLELVECLNHSWNSGTVTKQPGVGTTGTRTYTCTACGKTKTETIPAIVSMSNVNVSVSAQTYTGSAITPAITATYNSKTLVNGTDYSVSYSNNINAGTASVTLTGKGSYSGTKTVNFTINKRNASDFTVDSISSKTYTGSAIKPSVTVKYGGKTLVSGTDYSVAYSNNVEAGTATIKITGKGNFTGTKSVTFKIIKFTWKKIDGKWYYMDNNGKKATGFMTIDGSTYYFDSTGAMKTGWNQISSKWYYMNKSGVVQTGWQKISKKWYYFNDSGVMITGVKAIDGKYYYFNDSGVMQTGWQEISGKWYYFDKSGVRQSGWQQISKKWYYFNTSGVMQTGLKTIEGSKYFFNDNGSMLTGWKEISSKWYWFKSDGSMAVSETIKISGKSYTFNSKGVCTNP